MTKEKIYIHHHDCITGETTQRELTQEEIDALQQATDETPSPA